MKVIAIPNIFLKSTPLPLYKIGVILTTFVFLLVSLGGLVRNIGAGLSCPDWPLCYGQLVPSQLSETGNVYTSAQVFAEWFHRLLAGSVSVGLLGLVFVIFLNFQLRQALWKYCLFALCLLCAQVILGGLTVTGWLDPKWVTSHLVIGLAFFSTILWVTLRLRALTLKPKASFECSKWLVLLAPFAATMVYLQALLGGLVSSTGSGFACPDFPKCNGMWLPALEGGVPLQIMHRLGAVFTTVVVIFFTAACFQSEVSKKQLTSLAKSSLLFIPILLGLQILLGVSMVFYKIPLLMSVAHLMVATALLGSLLVVYHELKYS